MVACFDAHAGRAQDTNNTGNQQSKRFCVNFGKLTRESAATISNKWSKQSRPLRKRSKEASKIKTAVKINSHVMWFTISFDTR